jgi:putative endonuclease
MVKYWVYILQSESTGRYYCGSSNDVTRRVKQHNDSKYKGCKTTKRFSGPWELVWTEECETRSEAMRRERRIKKRGMKRFLNDQLNR